MSVNEQIVTGRKFRKLIDIVNKTWQRISFWTHSSDVEFEDGMTAETKVGAIDGITDSLASNSSRIAASAKAVNSLSNDLVSNVYVGDDGKIHVVKGGADTGLNFSNKPISNAFTVPNTNSGYGSYQIPQTYNGKKYIGLQSLRIYNANLQYPDFIVSDGGVITWRDKINSISGVALYL